MQFLCGLSAIGQGLEGIIVETYYITDKNDASGSGSESLEENSVTYRIYVDLKPGYRLQSVYGAPGHEMKLRTTTTFYNHSIHGHYISNLVMDKLLPGGALMLDSWISVGAGSQQRYAVLKAEDDTAYTISNLSRPPVLQNINAAIGVPLTFRDGLMVGDTLPPRVSQIGLEALLDSLFKEPTKGKGFEFITENGGWGCLGGSMGIDPKTNKILIGQFTTTGDFYFEFNLQIGSTDQRVENYVAREPVNKEQLHKDLIINIASPN